jgi:hypothetical protein
MTTRYFGFIAIAIIVLSPPAAASPLTKSREVWLRFHEAELCQGVDAVFAFSEKGIEIWSVVEEEKSYQKLLELLAPLRASQQVSLYATRPVPEKKSPEDRDPPPSLWNNMEIRSYFQDLRDTGQGGVTVRPKTPGDPDFLVKQRIMMFAVQTLELDRKMKRYTADLTEISEVAFGAEFEPGLRRRAADTCLAHTQGIRRVAEKLTENLILALPKGSKKLSERAERSKRSPVGPPDQSMISLASATRSIARRIYRFIHPEKHTVGLVDLREPSLLESLKSLRTMTEDFQNAAQKARARE